MHGSYWLYDWLDKNKITHVPELHSALDSRRHIASMKDRAREWVGDPAGLPSESNLIAGSGMGGYNGLSCLTPSCRYHKIDVLYRHAWHYFDYIYLPDAAGDLLRVADDHLCDHELRDLAKLIETAMYLRQMGASSLTRYYPEVVLGIEKSRALAGEKWDQVWLEMEQEFHGRRSNFEFHHEGGTRYKISYHDEELRFSPTMTLNLKKVPKNQRKTVLEQLLIKNMVARHKRALGTDLMAARRLNGSLGSTIWSHQWAMSKIGAANNESDIFFQMEFPSLENVPISDLISLRLDHRDSFEACRSSLRKAVREISTGAKSDRQLLAAEVVRDIVVPEISRLRHKLDAARTVLAKKSTIALAVAGVSTWVGVHFGFGMLPSVGAGTLAAFASGLKDAASKYSEEQRDLEVSDMSFLWKAMKCVDR